MKTFLAALTFAGSLLLSSSFARAEEVTIDATVGESAFGQLSISLHQIFPARFRGGDWKLVKLEAESSDSSAFVYSLMEDRIHEVGSPTEASRNELAELRHFSPIAGSRLRRIELRVQAEGLFTLRRVVGTFQR